MTKYLGIVVPVAALVAVTAMLGNVVYDIYDSKQPHHAVGTCLKSIDKHGNEFVEQTYEYELITVVGKERYKFIRFYFMGGTWNKYESQDEFKAIDRYGDPVVVDCDEVRIAIGK